MKSLRLLILIIIAMLNLQMAFSMDLAGKYTGLVDEQDVMVLVRQIGPSSYFIEIYEKEEITPSQSLLLKNDGTYRIKEEPLGAVLSFIEGVCNITNPQTDETVDFLKLFGPRGDISGSYQFPGSDLGYLGLFSVEKNGNSYDMNMELWNLMGTLYSDVNNNNKYDIIEGFYYGSTLSFNPDGSGTMSVDESEYSIKKDKNRKLYSGYSPVGDEGIAGLYSGIIDDDEVLLVTTAIGSGIYGFSLMNLDDKIDFGIGKPQTDGNLRQVDFDEALLTFTTDGLNLEDKSYNEMVEFQNISDTAPNDAGIYLAEDQESGYSMVLTLEKVDGHYTLIATVWGMDTYFDTRANSEHVYLHDEEYVDIIFAFTDDGCNIVAEEMLVYLKKLTTMEDTTLNAQHSGVIPDLKNSNAQAIMADFPGDISIDPDKNMEISFDGLNPVTISPNGIYIFAAEQNESGIYDLSTGEYIYREIIESAMLDYPVIQWASDSSKIAFNEDFYQRYLDADIHVVDTETGTHLNLTDDGETKFDFSKTSHIIDIFLFWLEGSDEFVFLRNRLSEGANLQKQNIVTGEIEMISPTLSYRQSIVNGFLDGMTGRVYYTQFGTPDSPDAGVWVLDPEKSQPVQIIRNTNSGSVPAVITDLSLNGEYLMLYNPASAMGDLNTDQFPAFFIYHIASDSIIPITVFNDDQPIFINNAVFSPDGNKVLFIYGAKGQRERHISVMDIGSGEVNILLSINDQTAGLSPKMTRSSGVVGLEWCDNNTLYVCVESGEKALILSP